MGAVAAGGGVGGGEDGGVVVSLASAGVVGPRGLSIGSEEERGREVNGLGGVCGRELGREGGEEVMVGGTGTGTGSGRAARGEMCCCGGGCGDCDRIAAMRGR